MHGDGYGKPKGSLLMGNLTKSKTSVINYIGGFFLNIFTHYRQGHMVGNCLKSDVTVLPNVEKISVISMHNIYWDTLYISTVSLLYTLARIRCKPN